MDISMKSIEKIITKQLEEHKKSILKETERLLKEQEKSFTLIMSANLKIITDRLDTIEKDNNNNKSKIKNIEKDLNEIKDSLSFQENKTLENISHLKKYYDNQINTLYKKSIDLENRSRRNNLRIDGLKESPGESWDDCEKEVKKFFNNQLKISKEVVIERAHRIGKKKDNKPRTIVLKLLNFHDKNKILNSLTHLKGTGIYINEDFAQETIEHRRKLWEEVKKLRSEGKYAILKYDKIFSRDFKNTRFQK
ncbi:uncharacterized protein LOC136072299 [Hydra vulgaris]|uniref:uncharacterized protein LOC136072299 n=1 Tax=Hydra vulgaris TaxID=6087 RepID=UPI0032EA1CFA